MSFSQLDTTLHFVDNVSLKADDWIKTAALNTLAKDPETMGLPPAGTGDEETYEAADRLSRMRESVNIPNDGVYCPICHIANVSLERLRKPCPQCGRPLLKFGWD